MGKNDFDFYSWAEKIVEIKGSRCEVCGEQGHTVHHILSQGAYPELKAELDNGFVICISCHYKTHIQPNFEAEVFDKLKLWGKVLELKRRAAIMRGRK